METGRADLKNNHGHHSGKFETKISGAIGLPYFINRGMADGINSQGDWAFGPQDPGESATTRTRIITPGSIFFF